MSLFPSSPRAPASCLGLLLLAWATLLPVAAQAPPAEETPVTLDQWLRGPDHQDFPWKLRLLRPRLNFEQRQMVVVRVTIPADKLQDLSPQRDLHLVVRLADENGNWFPGADRTHYSLRQAIDRSSNLQFTTAVYLRPGRYRVAAVLYDDVLRQHNVAHRGLAVPPLKHDPLPEAEAELPPVQFVDLRSYLERDDEVPQLKLPIANPQPLLVEVLINFSPSAQYTGRAPILRHNVSTLVQVAHVLSQLQLQHGCVRLTGVDVLGLRLLFDRVEADNIFWDRVLQSVSTMSPNVVDVSTLEGQKKTAAYFRDVVHHLLADKESLCLGPGRHPGAERVFLVAGSDMLFPPGNRIEPVALTADECNCRVFYLHGQLRLGDEWDQIHKILRPLRPRTLSMDTAGDFRKALAAIVADLQRPAAAAPLLTH